MVESNNVPPFWQEPHLIIWILNQEGPLPAEKLGDRVQEEQKKGITKNKSRVGLSHAPKTIGGWIKRLEESGIVSLDQTIVGLTALGKRIASSNKIPLDRFYDLVAYFKCLKCTNSPCLLKPVRRSSRANKKGDLFMDFECPTCRCKVRKNVNDATIKGQITPFRNEMQFITLYNMLAEELNRDGGSGIIAERV